MIDILDALCPYLIRTEIDAQVLGFGDEVSGSGAVVAEARWAVQQAVSVRSMPAGRPHGARAA